MISDRFDLRHAHCRIDAGSENLGRFRGIDRTAAFHDDDGRALGRGLDGNDAIGTHEIRAAEAFDFNKKGQRSLLSHRWRSGIVRDLWQPRSFGGEPSARPSV